MNKNMSCAFAQLIFLFYSGFPVFCHAGLDAQGNLLCRGFAIVKLRQTVKVKPSGGDGFGVCLKFSAQYLAQHKDLAYAAGLRWEVVL